MRTNRNFVWQCEQCSHRWRTTGTILRCPMCDGEGARFPPESVQETLGIVEVCRVSVDGVDWAMYEEDGGAAVYAVVAEDYDDADLRAAAAVEAARSGLAADAYSFWCASTRSAGDPAQCRRILAAARDAGYVGDIWAGGERVVDDDDDE